MESYEEMLDEAFEKIKPLKISSNFERFEIPKANSQVIGNKTVISNFLQIVAYLRRDPLHLAKFLSRELASFTKIENERLIINRKIQTNQINDKIAFYVEEFVVCKECKKPDTELVKEHEYMFIHCLACGAKHSVRAKI